MSETVERYPGEDYFREHNPNIRKAEENWDRKQAALERVVKASIAWQRARHGLRHWMKPDEVELNDAAHELDSSWEVGSRAKPKA